MTRHLHSRRGRTFLAPGLQLLLAAILCVLLPLLVQTPSIALIPQEPEALNTAVAALVALVLGFWLLQSVSQLPGTAESGGILPAFLTSYGLVFFAILLFRIDYSRSILLLSVLATIAFFFTIYMANQRTKLVLGVVAGGRVEILSGMDNVELRPLTKDKWPHDIDAIAVDLRFDHSEAWEARLADYVLGGLVVYHCKDLSESLTGRTDLEHLSENTFGSLAPLTTLLSVKSVIDRVIGLPVLVLLSPILLLTALAIKLDSDGPILFRQRRIGYRGEPFTVMKFRTMRDDAGWPRSGEPNVAHYITVENDTRITRVGRWLRRSRIDELPQIINILRGEMSWIGPRPEAARLSDWYREEVPFYRYRHVVKPGITGWAQVNQGHVAEIDDIREKLQFDFFYIKNFSLWLDLLIIAKTIKTMLNGFGHR